MKKIIFLVITLFQTTDPLSISYIPTIGRLGDQIINYAQSYWVYLKHKNEATFIAHDQNPFFTFFNMPFQTLPQKKRIPLDDECKITNFINKDVILMTHYYTKTDDIIEVGLNNPEFKETMQKTFLIAKPSIHFPKNHISIAIHIRKGGGADLPLKTELLKKGITNIPEAAADVYWPLKFPPDEFYLKQFEYLYALFKGQKLFVYIFTDDKNTQQFCDMFRQHFPDPNIIFSSRKEGNAWDKNDIIDLINMSHFDCLIRSESNYSKAAHLIGNHKIVIYPQSAYWDNDKLIVDKVRVLFQLNNKTTGINI